MLQFTKELIKETIILLIAVQVVWLLVPRWIRNGIKRFTRLVYKGGRGMTRYAKKHYKTYHRQPKKATQKALEQPSNIITIVTYPDGRKKKIYRKAK